MKTFSTISISLMALVLVACAPSAPTTPEQTSTPVPTRTPAIRATSSEPRTGEQLFLQHCASCHGQTGAGDGAVAIEAKLAPADFTQAETFEGDTLEDTIQIINTGNIEKMMPPWQAALKPDEIERVAVYVRSLASDG